MDRESKDAADRPARPNRREFLELVSLAPLASALPMPAMAGPFDDVNEYLRLIPEDKKLDPAWVASLTQRGTKQTYDQAEALAHIGMPVGGICAGTVYLRGNGQLAFVDVFNDDQEGIVPREVVHEGRKVGARDGANFLAPAPLDDLVLVWFDVETNGAPLLHAPDRSWKITFEGRYPIGRVSYRDPGAPLQLDLEAFAPFVPLNVDDSSLPATVLNFTVSNTSQREVQGALNLRLANTIGRSDDAPPITRFNRVVREDGLTMLVASVEETGARERPHRPDIVFADFEGENYAPWTAHGTAFGSGPIEVAKVPRYQGDLGGQGRRVVNSHASAPGATVQEKDAQTGKLVSPEFHIARDYIQFLIGGGNDARRTRVDLVIDGQVVCSATGKNANRMALSGFSVGQWTERLAHLEIIDEGTGGWGNIGVDHVVFSDRPPGPPLEERSDYGTMALAFLGHEGVEAITDDQREGAPGKAPIRPDEPRGTLRLPVTLAPGASRELTFFVAWHFPNLQPRGLGGRNVGNHYAARFADAPAVVRHVKENQRRLIDDTRKWVETWYDSTLPYWFLDRTMANTSTLATTTCHRFRDGRFWAWEGVGCCEGTCTHVWHYAQAPARLFPELERDTRRRVDFGLAQHADGGIGMRAGLDGANEPAHDGQCGRILGAYREHRNSPDDRFLRSLWPRIKKAIEYLIEQDGDADGMIEGAQPNTLDAAWYGRVPFLASLYVAALRAGEAMAREIGDDPFADRCRAIAARGALTILDLFNGEYFIQQEDPAHADAIGTGAGCYIDQVFGQTWAHWVGLDHLFDRDKQLAALRALWRYNFAPDVGPFRARFPKGRWYALAGDAGLLMCTWPRGGQRPDHEKHWQYMYFNECMTGFEWQAASHMIYEGIDQPDLLRDGLAIARAIHDRYDARRRNPYNEIECSDHYARAMASYGAFLAACGFEHHGPRGHIGFAPRISPDAFRAPFTAAEGWGTFAQEREGNALRATIAVRHGRLRLHTIALRPRDPFTIRRAEASLGDRAIAASVGHWRRASLAKLADEVVVETGQTLAIQLTP